MELCLPATAAALLMGTRDSGLALFHLSEPLIGVHSGIHKMGREQNTSLWKSGRREGEKNEIPFISSKTAKCWQKGLKVQQESSCAFALHPWDFSVSVEILTVPTVLFAASW